MSRGVAGDVAHGSPDVSDPVKIGGKAASSTPAAVSAGQRVNAFFDLFGRLSTLIWGNTAKDGSGTSYVPLLDSDGHLQTDVLSSPAAATNEALVSNTVLSDGTDKVLPSGYVYDDTAGTALTEDDIAAPRVDQKSAVVAVIEDGTVRARRAVVNSSGELRIAETTIRDWDNSASDGASVSGDVAHDGIDAGEPVKIGAKAIAHSSNPTAVAANDRTDLYANRHGIQFVLGGHPNIVTFEAAYTAAQTDTAIVSVAGGLKIVVTEIEALCDNANTVDVGVRIGFGAANTPTTTGVVLTHPGIAPGSGVVRGAGSGILGVGADGEDLRVTAETPTGGNLRILVSYHTIDS